MNRVARYHWVMTGITAGANQYWTLSEETIVDGSE